MKQSFKYGLLVVLALLLHLVTVRAAEATVWASAEGFQEEECSVSQAHPVHNAFQRFYIYYSEMPCEMSHAEVSYIPADKSCVRFFSHFREHKAMNTPFFASSLHSSIYSLSDPVSYYVFGLKKIIV